MLKKLVLTLLLVVSFSVNFPETSSATKEFVENFRLLDHQGKSHELFYYQDKPAIVLIWQKNGCPYIEKNISYVNNLIEEYKNRDVQFFWINAEPENERASIISEAKRLGISNVILLDDSQIITLGFDVTHSLETILIDPKNWSIVYHGAIHDQSSRLKGSEQIRQHFLKEALENLLNLEPVRKSSTTSKGTNYHFKENKLTYIDDASVIIREKCNICHLPGGVAPFAFKDYSSVKGWSPMIREVLRTKRMPPWGVDPIHKNLEYDLSISPEETNTIIRWIRQGMIRGEGNDPLNVPTEELYADQDLGEPDIIIKFPEMDIPRTGILPYYFESVELNNPEEMWIKAVKFMPTNFGSTHHVGAMVIPEDIHFTIKDKRIAKPELGTVYDYYVGSWTAGRDPVTRFPEDSGFFMGKNSKLVVQRHYLTNGKSEKDQISIGLYLHDKKPDTRVIWHHYSKHPLNIPPHVDDLHMTLLTDKLEYDTKIYAYKPHMHFRGIQMKATAVYPDNSEELLFSIPDYDFFWQYIYFLKKPKTLPAGTQIRVENTFDNSAKNPANPDPNRHVTWGQTLNTEMFVFGILYTMEDEEGNFHRLYN